MGKTTKGMLDARESAAKKALAAMAAINAERVARDKRVADALTDLFVGQGAADDAEERRAEANRVADAAVAAAQVSIGKAVTLLRGEGLTFEAIADQTGTTPAVLRKYVAAVPTPAAPAEPAEPAEPAASAEPAAATSESADQSKTAPADDEPVPGELATVGADPAGSAA